MVVSKGKSRIFSSVRGMEYLEKENRQDLLKPALSTIYPWPLDHERRTHPFSHLVVVNMRKNLGQNEARGNKHHVDAVLPTT